MLDHCLGAKSSHWCVIKEILIKISNPFSNTKLISSRHPN